MLTKKSVSSLLVILTASILIFFFANSYLLLSGLLVILAYLKHLLIPIKKELLWYLIIALGGAVIEVALVNGPHAWEYTYGQIFNIPIYMPLFWGVIGTSIVVMYEGFTGHATSKKKRF